MLTRWSKLKRLVSIAPERQAEIVARLAHLAEARLDRIFPQQGRYQPVAFDQAMTELSRLWPGSTFESDAALAKLEAEIESRRESIPGDHPMAFTHCAGPALGRAAYWICRALGPETVVETGVAYGVTTAYILGALEANGRGRLHSIDLPPISDESGSYVGHLVPAALRHRWALHRGPSLTVLPRVLAQCGSVDLFLHDALHTYWSMQREFKLAWACLAAGGVLVSDDVRCNAAFERFVSQRRPRTSLVIAGQDGRGCFGVALK